jgi:hypothetical protein
MAQAIHPHVLYGIERLKKAILIEFRSQSAKHATCLRMLFNQLLQKLCDLALEIAHHSISHFGGCGRHILRSHLATCGSMQWGGPFAARGG